MRSAKVIFLLLLVSLAGCKKSTLEPIGNTVLGQWIYTEYYYSIGSPGEWRSVSPPGQTIEFRADGSFVPSESFLTDANHFTVVDSATIKFEPSSTQAGYILMGYSIDTIKRELSMYPVNPICIEGCGYRFTRK